MITIYRRDGSVLFRSETATTQHEAIAEIVDAARKAGTRADLTRAYLTGADLAGADLAGANLAGANLAGADLAGANLAGADLTGADLAGANLAGADLTGADLTRAYLTRANLAGADLAGAYLIDGGTESRGYRWLAVKGDDGIIITAGCRRFTLSEAHAHWGGEHSDGEAVGAECRARLAMIEAVALAKGWL